MMASFNQPTEPNIDVNEPENGTYENSDIDIDEFDILDE